MQITASDQQIHKQMWNNMDLNSMKNFLLQLNPRLSMKDVDDNMFWNDLLDLDYDRAYVAFINCLNNIY